MRRDADGLKHELGVLSRLARALASATRLDDVLIEAVRAVCEVLQSDGCVLYLYDEDLRELTQRAAWGEKLDPVTRQIVIALRLQLGQGIVGWVAASRVVEIIDDVTPDRRNIPDLDPGGFRRRCRHRLSGAAIGFAAQVHTFFARAGVGRTHGGTG